jgi:two-component system chemotaxis response regulator CheB
VSLPNILQRGARLRVREPLDKDPIRPGFVYLAPPDYHLLVERHGFALSTDGPVCHARPSIDVLFESAADAFGRGAIGVILTGASSDGAAGVAAIHRRGGRLIVQDPATAEGSAMPRAALSRAPGCRVLALREIPAALIELCVPGGATSAA